MATGTDSRPGSEAPPWPMPWLKAYPEKIAYDFAFEPRPLQSILDRAADRWPDNGFMEFLGRRWTYAEGRALVDRAARGFRALGVGKGVHVGLFLPNCPQFVIAYFGILKAGGTVVNFSPLYSEPELEAQIEDSETTIMVTLDLELLYPKMKALLPRTCLSKLVVSSLTEVLPFPKRLLYPLVRRTEIASVAWDDAHVRFADLIDNDGAVEPVPIDPREDVAVLQYTGGTTGVAKGAMLTHANLVANTEQARNWFTNCDEGAERTLAVLPFFHVFAMTAVLNMSIHIGAELVIHPRFELGAVLKDIHRKRPTMMHGVPTMYNALANHPRISSYDLSSIKGCISGGAPLPVEVKQKFERLASCILVEGYGLTETSPIATCNPLEALQKTGSIGLPVPGTHIVITDREDPSRILGVGEDGEICVVGPQVMKGYWRRPEATADTIVDGRLRTGDVGYLDEDGYTFIIDRMKDLILASGFNVYPRTVEEAIYRHSAVEEVTVIGVPDDYRGEAPKAFVKLRDGAEPVSQESMLDFLKDRLGRHEMPREIEFRDALPKTLVGKLSKKELVAEEKAKHAAAKAAARGGQGA